MSEIGEQWSPNIAPAKTELMTLVSTEYSPVPKAMPPPRLTVSGITSGIKMAIVAQEVPVAKAMAAAVQKTRAGKVCTGRESVSIWER